MNVRICCLCLFYEIYKIVFNLPTQPVIFYLQHLSKAEL